MCPYTSRKLGPFRRSCRYFGRKKCPAISSAAGPLILMIPTPPSPGGVTMAAMVSPSISTDLLSRGNHNLAERFLPLAESINIIAPAQRGVDNPPFLRIHRLQDDTPPPSLGLVRQLH